MVLNAYENQLHFLLFLVLLRLFILRLLFLVLAPPTALRGCAILAKVSPQKGFVLRLDLLRLDPLRLDPLRFLPPTCGRLYCICPFALYVIAPGGK
jgi:hypothetical protein